MKDGEPPLDVVDGAFSFVGPVELGAQTITVTARNGLSTSDSTTIDLTVVPAPLVAPVITSPADRTTVTETVTAVSGTAAVLSRDADGALTVLLGPDDLERLDGSVDAFEQALRSALTAVGS